MGVCSYLVSDSTKEYFEFGKILWGSEMTTAMKSASGDVEAVIRDTICDENYNRHCEPQEAARMAKLAVAWMKMHPDWRVVTDCDEDFDDVYLAVDAADATEYMDEFTDECMPIYMKTGSIWDRAE